MSRMLTTLWKCTPIAALALTSAACTTTRTAYSDPTVGSNCLVTRTATFGSQVNTELLGFDNSCAEASKIATLFGSGDTRLASLVAAAQIDVYRQQDPAFAESVIAQVSERVPNFGAMLKQGEYNLSVLSEQQQGQYEGYARDNINKGVFVPGNANSTTFVVPEGNSSGPN